MATPIKPPFDLELATILKQIPKQRDLAEEGEIINRRKLTAIEPSAVLTDPEILHEEIVIPGDIAVTVLRSKKSSGGKRPGILWIHGGAMVLGTRYYFLGGTFEWVKQLDAVVVSVEYRLAPEHPSPANLDDCYATVEWMAGNAVDLGVDTDKLMIAGGSAGAGLAAGVALLARDRNGPKLYAQLLIYPMLDDRNVSTSSKQYYDEGTWTGKANIIAWDALLPGKRGTEDVSIYAAPSRAKDLSGLPQAFIDVGSCEPFRDEDVPYAAKLWECGVQCELHVWPGAWLVMTESIFLSHSLSKRYLLKLKNTSHLLRTC